MKQVKLVAILNITPNSFSDGGLFIESSDALKQVQKLLQAKPDVIDIGAVSTRPKSVAPSIEEEKERFDNVLPAILPIIKDSSVEISIDSYNFEVLQYLMEKMPIAWINDQSGFEDKRIIDLAKDTDIKLVVMHNVTLHVDPKRTVPEDLNVTLVVKDWLLKKAEYLMSYGIRKDQIIFDPGVGMGKTAEQSWQLIRDAKEFVNLDYPVYYGHSRKSFTNLVTDRPFLERDIETAVISGYLSNQGVDYLRVHDVEMNARAISVNKHLI